MRTFCEFREAPLHNIDFSSWQSLLATLIGLALFTLIGVGIRLLAMFTVQQRRERMNRQINERLRTLIAAYKTLGGSFTGNLTVDPKTSARSAPRRRTRIRERGHRDPGTTRWERGEIGPQSTYSRCGRGSLVGHHPAGDRRACPTG